MNRTRAERRHNKFKFRAKTRKIIVSWDSNMTDEEIVRKTAKMEQHRRQCSCIRCRQEKYRDKRAASKHVIGEQE